MANDSLSSAGKETRYGGVGIENVKQRLAIYYPGKHELKITNEENSYTVQLTIKFE